jgi:hypothetical protein
MIRQSEIQLQDLRGESLDRDLSTHHLKPMTTPSAPSASCGPRRSVRNFMATPLSFLTVLSSRM